MGKIRNEVDLPDKITINYYAAYDHFYPQIFFRHFENFKEMLRLGAKQMGTKEVEFKEIKNENPKQKT